MADPKRLAFTFQSTGTTTPVRVVSAYGHDQPLREATAISAMLAYASSAATHLRATMISAVHRRVASRDASNDIDLSQHFEHVASGTAQQAQCLSCTPSTHPRQNSAGCLPPIAILRCLSDENTLVTNSKAPPSMLSYTLRDTLSAVRYTVKLATTSAATAF